MRHIGLLATTILISIYGIHPVSANIRLADALTVSDDCKKDKSMCSPEESEKLEIANLCRDSNACDHLPRLSAYQPNYAIFQKTEDDESSLQVHYSFRYIMTNPDCMPIRKLSDSDAATLPIIECLRSYSKRMEFYFTYTGEFDFYAGSRTSDPVINRVSNPALHYRKYLEDAPMTSNASIEWLNIGFEHRSDGQVVEANKKVTDTTSADYGKYIAQLELDKNNHEYFDSISRGANYVSLETKLNIGESNADKIKCDHTPSCLNLYVSAKLYWSDDSKVYWGKLANSGVRIYDYDRARIILADKFATKHRILPEMEIGVEWTIGDKLMETDSIDLNIFLPINISDRYRIPFYLRAHKGPMSTLSDYTKEQNYIGIGVRFR